MYSLLFLYKKFMNDRLKKWLGTSFKIFFSLSYRDKNDKHLFICRHVFKKVPKFQENTWNLTSCTDSISNSLTHMKQISSLSMYVLYKLWDMNLYSHKLTVYTLNVIWMFDQSWCLGLHALPPDLTCISMLHIKYGMVELCLKL